MAVIAPTPIDAGPAVPSSADSETTFDAAYEAFNAWEKNQLQPQANALASNVFNNAQEAVTAANTATAEADAAMGYRNTANSAATTATNAASTATTKAAEAEASAVQASKLNLGAKASSPTVDNQGAALLTGAMYFDTTLGKWRAWNGAAWVDPVSVTAGVTSLNGQSGALTIQYGLRNKIINGKMEIAQRGTSVAMSSAGGGFLVDRFAFGASATTAVVNYSHQVDAPASSGLLNSLRITTTTADSSVGASDFALIQQGIEGYNVRDLVGKTFTVSFWVRSSKIGIHCIGLRNSGGDRTYVGEYTVNAANTWEYKTITVLGGLPSSGTWNFDNGAGLYLRFTLIAGSSQQASPSVWQSGEFIATANQVNCLDAVGNIFAITGVQLEVGSVATPFEHRPYGMELALCQRYYYRFTPTAADQTLGVGHNTSTTASVATAFFPVPMRTDPSALEQSGTAGNYSVAHAATSTVCSAVPTLLAASPFVATITLTVASGLTAGQGSRARAVNASSYLGFPAEL